MRATTPAEACEILQSAIAYLQVAGFNVRAGNRDAGLVIVVPGAEVVTTDTGTQFQPVPARLAELRGHGIQDS